MLKLCKKRKATLKSDLKTIIRLCSASPREFESLSVILKLLRLQISHLSPLAVPKIVCSLFASHNFDRYANSHSLYRPPGAVVLLARAGTDVRFQIHYSKPKKKASRRMLFLWRRRRDSNSRAGFPTYALSRGASSPT